MTLCHRTGSVAGGNQHNGYDIITVDIASSGYVKGGHTGHEQVGNGPGPDIIPAYDAFAKNGKNWEPFSFPGLNLDYVFSDGTTGSEFLANGCQLNTPEDQVTKVNARFFNPTCDDPDGGILTVYNQDEATVKIDGNVAPDEKVTVTFTAKDGFVIEGQTVFTHTYGPAPVGCNPPPPTEVTPHVQFVDPDCDSPKLANVNVEDVEGVKYGMVGEVAPGSTVTVTATAMKGFEIVGKSEWTHTFAESPTAAECSTPPHNNPGPPESNPPAELPHTGGSNTPVILAGAIALLVSGSGMVAGVRLFTR